MKLTEDEFEDGVNNLLLCWPDRGLSADQMCLWYSQLCHLEPDIYLDAVARIIGADTEFPVISRVRDVANALRRGAEHVTACIDVPEEQPSSRIALALIQQSEAVESKDSYAGVCERMEAHET